MKIRFEGVVDAPYFDPKTGPLPPAGIQCSDGTVWVIDYHEQSPFRVFHGRKVLARGEPYRPTGATGGYIIGWSGAKEVGHLRIASLRPAELSPDLELAEVGLARCLSGALERGTSDAGDSTLSFITQDGSTFSVVNDPAGEAVGRNIEVVAYPVRVSPSTWRSRGPYLWIICPYSCADLLEWHKRRGSRISSDPHAWLRPY
jgi:hypothetical protein